VQRALLLRLTRTHTPRCVCRRVATQGQPLPLQMQGVVTGLRSIAAAAIAIHAKGGVHLDIRASNVRAGVGPDHMPMFKLGPSAGMTHPCCLWWSWWCCCCWRSRRWWWRRGRDGDCGGGGVLLCAAVSVCVCARAPCVPCLPRCYGCVDTRECAYRQLRCRHARVLRMLLPAHRVHRPANPLAILCCLPTLAATLLCVLRRHPTCAVIAPTYAM
jgi:hypothetical protein